MATITIITTLHHFWLKLDNIIHTVTHSKCLYDTCTKPL